MTSTGFGPLFFPLVSVVVPLLCPLTSFDSIAVGFLVGAEERSFRLPAAIPVDDVPPLRRFPFLFVAGGFPPFRDGRSLSESESAEKLFFFLSLSSKLKVGMESELAELVERL